MHPYLTDEEIAHITAPLTQGAARCNYIAREYGVKVKKRPNGQPLVIRAEFEAAGLAKGRPRRDQPADSPSIVRPNWERLRAHKRKSAAVVG